MQFMKQPQHLVYTAIFPFSQSPDFWLSYTRFHLPMPVFWNNGFLMVLYDCLSFNKTVTYKRTQPLSWFLTKCFALNSDAAVHHLNLIFAHGCIIGAQKQVV